MKSEIDSGRIAKSIKRGDIEELLKWVDANKQRLYKLSWCYLKNSADVEDVFHNTIIKVVENINKLQKEQAFEGWFVSILLNECRRILRDRKKVQPSDCIELGDTACSFENRAESMDLIEGLKNIDEEYRALIILKYYSGYSQKEIAEVLNMPLGTVKTKIFRGLKILRGILRKEA